MVPVGGGGEGVDFSEGGVGAIGLLGGETGLLGGETGLLGREIGLFGGVIGRRVVEAEGESGGVHLPSHPGHFVFDDNH